MNITSDLQHLFPIPVGRYNFNQKFTIEELNYINNLEKVQNLGNQRTADSYVLKNDSLKDISIFCNECVSDYFNKIYKPTNDVNIKITQSWLNYTEKNQFHHKHNHWNSFISGVVYINCNKENETITFFKEKHEMLNFETKEYNLWNSKTWSFVVNNGDVVLFPSELEHMVQVKTTDNTRISLSFNVFVKGHLGSEINLTKLILT